VAIIFALVGSGLTIVSKLDLIGQEIADWGARTPRAYQEV
jgi:hypothetical protein